MNWMKCNIVDSINVLESICHSIGAVTLEGKIVFGILYIGIADGHSTFNGSKSETCKLESFLVKVEGAFTNSVKFIYSEKATKFWEISPVDLSHVVTVKSTVEISKIFVAFSEYMNFNNSFLLDYFEFKQKLKLFKLFGTGYFC